MFTFIQKNLDLPEFEEISFEIGNLSMSVIPKANMVISSIKRNNVELLGQRKGIRGYKENLSSFAFPFMAPWINRMTTTEYEFDGKQYSFEKEGLKLDNNGYPMHGLLTANPNWKYKLHEGAGSLSIIAKFEYNESVAGFQSFPFKHDIHLVYILTAKQIRIKTKIVNKNETRIPIAFGFHPHYNEAKNINIHGIKNEIPLNSKTIPVSTENFNPNDTDSTAKMYYMLDGWHVDMMTSIGLVKIETNNYPFLLVWTPEDSDCVAIEPMTSNIDPMNNNPTSISANETYEAEYSLSFN